MQFFLVAETFYGLKCDCIISFGIDTPPIVPEVPHGAGYSEKTRKDNYGHVKKIILEHGRVSIRELSEEFTHFAFIFELPLYLH